MGRVRKTGCGVWGEGRKPAPPKTGHHWRPSPATDELEAVATFSLATVEAIKEAGKQETHPENPEKSTFFAEKRKKKLKMFARMKEKA